MRLIFTILVPIAGLAIAPLASAGDLIVSRAALEDVTGTLTIADAARGEFKPIGPTLSKGFTDSVHWLRIRVRAPAKGSEVVLFIRQPFLNEVRLYEAVAGDPLGWKTRVTGNYYPYSERDRARSSLGFVVSVAAPESTYYLRLKTRSSSQLSVEALEPAEAEREDDQLDLLAVFFVTSMVLLLLWAVHSYLLDRLRIVGLFAIHQVVYTLFGVAITGYLAPFAPAAFPHLVDLATTILYCGTTVTIVCFCRELFRPYEPPPVLMRGLNLFLLAFPIQLAAVTLGYTPFAMIVNFVLTKITWFYFVVMVFVLRRELSPSRRLLQVFFVTITLVFTLFWIVSLGSATSTKRHLYGRQTLIANGLIMGGLFAMILNARSRRLQLEAQQSGVDLLVTQKTLELERALKEAAESQARTDDLTGLFNRRHFIELAENEPARAFRYKRPLSLLMIDIDHFKTINDTWGHRAGDAVLQNVSRLLRAGMRNVDILGRMGGEEFAAVLVETDVEHAMRVAQRLCGAVANASTISEEGVPLRVTISLGVAGLKGRDFSFDKLLNEADVALYRAKQMGRNRVVSSA